MQGEKIHDVLLLHAERTTREWVDHVNYKSKTVSHFMIPVAKDPENSISADFTAIKNIGFQENVQSINDENDNDDDIDDDDSNVPIPEPKIIYNHTIDAFNMIENRRRRKGFLNARTIGLHNKSIKTTSPQIMGIYCVRWRRSGELSENESKFIVNAIEIVEAPLNISCYLDETMYVKVPMTLKISLQNTTNLLLHLKTGLRNADNFMFAGHSQVHLQDIICGVFFLIQYFFLPFFDSLISLCLHSQHTIWSLICIR